MHVCGQTLVLVDNDATVSAVNQKLVRAVLKYMFYHSPVDRTFCLDTYEHDIADAEEYENDPNDLACKVDKIEFVPKDSNLCDTLCEVITRWKESDFACRDIVVFTDGLEGESLFHEKEELYYLTERNEYPVYIVMLDQEDNAGARKGLSATAVTSGGKFFETEFEGSDAEVDRQLTEKIFASMDEYARVNWEKYEQYEAEEEYEYTEPVYEEQEEVTEIETEADRYMSDAETEERVVYEYDKTTGLSGSGKSLATAAVLMAVGLIVALVIASCVRRKRRDMGDKAAVPDADGEEDAYFDDYELGLAENRTLFLDDPDDDSDRPTRLLSESGRMITLEERTKGTKIRILLEGRMTVGRGDCEVVIGDDALSRRHCELYERADKVYVRDLSSANGTRVNGVKISDKCIEDGDELTMGTGTYTVRL